MKLTGDRPRTQEEIDAADAAWQAKHEASWAAKDLLRSYERMQKAIFDAANPPIQPAPKDPNSCGCTPEHVCNEHGEIETHTEHPRGSEEWKYDDWLRYENSK